MLFLDTAQICKDLGPLINLVKHGIIPLIQIGIPIILIILGMLDLGKAVMASKEDEIKNAQKMLIKRCIYAIAIFFVVLIVQLVFNLLTTTGSNDISSTSATWSSCWGQY